MRVLAIIANLTANVDSHEFLDLQLLASNTSSIGEQYEDHSGEQYEEHWRAIRGALASTTRPAGAGD